MRKYLAVLAALLLACGLVFGPKAIKAGVTCSLPFNLQNNTTADATQVMANYNALVTCLGNAAAAGTNSDITALLGLLTPLTPTVGGSSVFVGGTTTGSANGQVLGSTVPTGFTLTNGYQVVFTAGFTNTASPTTLNVNATGATNIYHPTPSGNELLSGGEIVAGNTVVAAYNSTIPGFEISAQNQLGGVGTATSITAATTTQLGSAVNHNATITGNTTVNSFGSVGASLAEPLYRITFTGAPLLTYSATSMILPGLANIQAAANDTAIAIYLGSSNWQVVNYQKANGTAVVNPTPLRAVQGLVIKNNAGTPATQIDITAGAAVLIKTAGNVPYYATSWSCTINLTNGTGTSAANGMDGEARGTSNWIPLFLISDGTSNNCLASSATGNNQTPTLPTNYIYFTYIGAMRVDGSGNLLTSRQVGNIAQLVVGGANVPFLTGMASANVGNVWTAIATAAFVPPTATRIKVVLQGGSVGFLAVAPNGSYPLPGTGVGALCGFAAGLVTNQQCEFDLESTNIFYENNSTGNGVLMFGWTDAVNAS